MSEIIEFDINIILKDIRHSLQRANWDKGREIENDLITFQDAISIVEADFSSNIVIEFYLE